MHDIQISIFICIVIYVWEHLRVLLAIQAFTFHTVRTLIQLLLLVTAYRRIAFDYYFVHDLWLQGLIPRREASTRVGALSSH